MYLQHLNSTVYVRKGIRMYTASQVFWTACVYVIWVHVHGEARVMLLWSLEFWLFQWNILGVRLNFFFCLMHTETIDRRWCALPKGALCCWFSLYNVPFSNVHHPGSLSADTACAAVLQCWMLNETIGVRVVSRSALSLSIFIFCHFSVYFPWDSHRVKFASASLDKSLTLSLSPRVHHRQARWRDRGKDQGRSTTVGDTWVRGFAKSTHSTMSIS